MDFMQAKLFFLFKNRKIFLYTVKICANFIFLPFVSKYKGENNAGTFFAKNCYRRCTGECIKKLKILKKVVDKKVKNI
jgi:hypothetical protein